MNSNNLNVLSYNPILAVDSYKLSHAFAYPKKVTGMFSYIEARTKGNDIIVPFGMQMFLRKFLTIQVTTAHIDEAETFAALHGEPFDRSKWEYIVEKYNGYLPLKIRAVREGTPVRSGNAIVTIECDDNEVFWLTSYIETALLRGIWYPTTIASMDYLIKRDLKDIYDRTGADLNMLPFALHDFGGRGVTSSEQAEIGGAAHLVNFMGSDTIEGVRAANFYYSESMAAFSVPATEHSVECSFGSSPAEEIEYIRHVIKNLGRKGGIVSIVIDGYDVYRAATAICTTLRNEVIESGVKLVFRPDSGDMMETVIRILEMQAATFGTTVNAMGFKKVNYVGILQGDGVDHDAIRKLLNKIADMGYAADNVVFGSGGALLQKVNRDTYKFAQKASAIRVKEGDEERWIGISKDPITDPGKKSKEGRMTLVRSRMTGEVLTLTGNGDLNAEFEDLMVTVYDKGVLYNPTTLAEVRARCAV